MQYSCLYINTDWKLQCSIYLPLSMFLMPLRRLLVHVFELSRKTQDTVTGSHGAHNGNNTLSDMQIEQRWLSLSLAPGSDTAAQSTACQKSCNEEATWTRGKTSSPRPGALEMLHLSQKQMEAFHGGSARFCEPLQIPLPCKVSHLKRWGNLPMTMSLWWEVFLTTSSLFFIVFLRPGGSTFGTCLLYCDPWPFLHPLVPLTLSLQMTSRTAAHPHMWPAPPLKYHRILALDVTPVPTNTTQTSNSFMTPDRFFRVLWSWTSTQES